jgi:hypothetical protein
VRCGWLIEEGWKDQAKENKKIDQSVRDRRGEL